MVNPFLSKSTGLFNPIPQNNTIKPAKPQSEEHKQKTDYSRYAIEGLSLIALGTTAGMIYFARQNAKLGKNIVSKISETSKTIEEKVAPQVTETTPKPAKKAVVQGIIRDISKDLQEYLKTCKDGKINPEKVDEILTRAVGEENVYERPFKATPLHPRGRVKQYTSPNGRVYVLETHEVLGKNVTRLYMHDKDKHLRAYLFPDGTFRLNSFKSEESHFITTAKGKRWMEKSRFLNNGTTKPISKN